MAMLKPFMTEFGTHHIQSTTGIAEKTVRLPKSAKVVVSAKAVVACTHILAK